MNPPSDADWLSVLMHYVFGAVLGCLLGFGILARMRELHTDGDFVLTFVSGTTLIVAGLGAQFGDRLWLGNNYSIIPPDGIKHNKLSLYVAIFSIVLGCALSGISLAEYLFAD